MIELEPITDWNYFFGNLLYKLFGHRFVIRNIPEKSIVCLRCIKKSIKDGK